MKSIKALVMKSDKPVYFHTLSKAAVLDFLRETRKKVFVTRKDQ